MLKLYLKGLKTKQKKTAKFSYKGIQQNWQQGGGFQVRE